MSVIEEQLRERILQLENTLRMTQSTLAWCQGFIMGMPDGQGNPIGERKHVKDAIAIIDKVLQADLPAKIPDWALSEEAFDKFWGKEGAPFPDEDPKNARTW